MQIVLDGRYKTDRSVVALGMFDGVHIGHRVLLKRGRVLADRLAVPLVACTFQEHPLRVIAPESCPPMLTTFEERARLMEALGVDVLDAMPFDRRIMDMLPEEYVGQLVRRFHPRAVVCGYNHTFGRQGQGSPALLNALGGALGFETSIVPKITLMGKEVSSTAIRAALSRGEARNAFRLLGRPYERCISVISRRGDCCEMMLMPDGKQEMPSGEYRVLYSQGEKSYPALLRVRGAGRADCALPLNVQEGEEGIVRFLINTAHDC